MSEMVGCQACGAVGKADVRVRGSNLLEAVGWLLFLVPGIVYSLWRASEGRVRVCAACGSEQVFLLQPFRRGTQ